MPAQSIAMWLEIVLSGVTITTSWLASRAIAAPPRPASGVAGISILRPCEGEEAGLAQALAPPSGATLGPIEVIACTTSHDDPAAAIARAAGASVAIDRAETQAWTNPKARHLDAGLQVARGPTIVLADADAHLDGAQLESLTGALSEPGVSGVFAPPMAAVGRSWGNRVLRTALGGSLYAWPALVSLTSALGQPLPMSGALVAFRREDLPDGFAAAAHAIGDDLVVANALQARGRLRLVARPVICLHGEIGLAQALGILRRWVFVAAIHDPWRLLGFPLLFSATPLLLLLLASGPALPAAIALGLALLARVLAAHRIRSRLLRERVSLADLLLVELLLLDAAARAVWAVATRRELAWRHRRYKLGRGGRIEAVRSVSQ